MKKLEHQLLHRLQSEIGEWAERNFTGKHGPFLGVIEEIGEMAHCLLKRRQGIRGFNDPDFFKAQLSDALADTGIYLLHGSYIRHAEAFKFDLLDFDKQELTCGINTDEAWIAGFSVVAAMLAIEGEESEIEHEPYGYMLGGLQEFADLHGIDFVDVLEATWERVKKRDWVTNPANADKVASEPAKESIGAGTGVGIGRPGESDLG